LVSEDRAETGTFVFLGPPPPPPGVVRAEAGGEASESGDPGERERATESTPRLQLRAPPRSWTLLTALARVSPTGSWRPEDHRTRIDPSREETPMRIGIVGGTGK